MWNDPVTITYGDLAGVPTTFASSVFDNTPTLGPTGDQSTTTQNASWADITGSSISFAITSRYRVIVLMKYICWNDSSAGAVNVRLVARKRWLTV